MRFISPISPKLYKDLCNNIKKVSRTLNRIGEVMKPCIGTLTNIATPRISNYHLQMRQDPYITYLNALATNEQGARQNKKL